MILLNNIVHMLILPRYDFGFVTLVKLLNASKVCTTATNIDQRRLTISGVSLL